MCINDLEDELILKKCRPPVKYFTDHSKAVPPFVDLLWLFFRLVFVMPLCASAYLCLLVTCREKADLLAFVCGV